MADDKGDVGAIFARLQDEIRCQAGSGGLAAPVSSYHSPTARLRAERTWSVSAERPFQDPPDPGFFRRRLGTPSKRILRKLMRWYVEPLAAEQRSFNLAILTLVDELGERASADIRRLEDRLEALEDRLSDHGAKSGT